MYFTILTLSFLIPSLISNAIVFNIEDGPVKGNIVEFNNKKLDVFRGTRYGKPTIGHLRFKRPEKVNKWTDVYDATDKYLVGRLICLV